MKQYPRFDDWKQRLDAYVDANRDVPFDWQGQNCSTFAAGWVTECTGRVIEVPVTKTALSACKAMKSIGGLFADACRQLGDSIPGLMAQAGDVVLVTVPYENEQRKAFGVCLGAMIAAQGIAGLVMLPITEAEAAWRV